MRFEKSLSIFMTAVFLVCACGEEVQKATVSMPSNEMICSGPMGVVEIRLTTTTKPDVLELTISPKTVAVENEMARVHLVSADGDEKELLSEVNLGSMFFPGHLTRDERDTKFPYLIISPYRADGKPLVESRSDRDMLCALPKAP